MCLVCLYGEGAAENMTEVRWKEGVGEGGG